MNGYQPPSYVPTAYRPCNNPAVCSSFVLCPTLAVGAVGTLTSFTVANDRSPCILLPGQHRCTCPATTFTSTRTQGASRALPGTHLPTRGRMRRPGSDLLGVLS